MSAKGVWRSHGGFAASLCYDFFESFGRRIKVIFRYNDTRFVAFSAQNGAKLRKGLDFVEPY
jgi:hypothetical protein